MAEKYDMPILYSCHPRSRNRLAASGFKLDKTYFFIAGIEENVSTKVVKIIQSYTGIVNKMVWRKF
jgi:UDP-N-acetylglucosamine 2-epimerase